LTAAVWHGLKRPLAPVAIVIVLTAVWSLAVVVLPRSATVPHLLFNCLVLGLLQLLTVAILIVRSRAETQTQAAWGCLAAGAGITALSNLLSVAGLQSDPGAPRPSDVLTLVSLPLLALGAARLLLPTPARSRTDRVDGAIMTMASAAVLFAAWQPGVTWETSTASIVALAFLVADVAVLALMSVAMLSARWHLSPAGTLLWAAILVWAVGDAAMLSQTLSGSQAWPSPAALTAPIGFALLAVAGVAPDGPGTSEQAKRWATRVPAHSALLAGTILVFGVVRPVPVVATLLACASLMLAVTRQFITLAELDRADRIHTEARTDDLTGLLNRRGMYEALATRLSSQPAVALLMIDLDAFKDINDSLGHQAGDEMLMAVADRFRRACPPDVDVARLGGDEFAVAMSDISSAKATAEALLASIREPARVADMAVRVSASIGIACYPQHARDSDELLRTADVAMYMAKRDHAAIAQYRAELDPHSRDQLELLDELRSAVPAGQLVVLYQPQCRLSDGTISSVEALLRWDHPTRGQLLPSMFIEQAEASGIICELTNFVLDRALGDMRRWLDSGADLNLSVNISGVDLARLDLPDVVSRALDRFGVSPERLTLELTETVMTSDAALAKRLVSRLQARGVRISMDDFGIGFSSLAQALSLPLDEIKLDRSLVAAAKEPKGRAILRTAVRLARAVGASVVAEGVEDLRALNFVRSIGADFAQGYLIARPMPAEQVVGCAGTVPAALSASLAVVSKPRGGRAARNAAGDGNPNTSLPTQKTRPTEPPTRDGDSSPGPQNDTTGGADWPSGAW
jgi:diguanylate cyclase (GGDEF)-like protein